MILKIGKEKIGEKYLETNSMKNNNSKKNAIHFAFSAVDFAKITDLARKADQTAIVKIAASTIELNDVNIGKCNELFFTTTQDGNFVDVDVQKKVSDNTLLSALFTLHEMDPEALYIIVSSSADVSDYYWEIMIFYDENVATVCYDCSIRKRDAIKLFGDCFK